MTTAAISREFASGAHWIPACLAFEHKGEILHGHNSTYLVVGSERALLVDAGHPSMWRDLDAVLDRVLGSRPLDFVFPTHPEMPHAGGLPQLIERFPDITVCGDTRDYHLYHPDIASRLSPMTAGDRVELGGTTVRILQAVVRDLPNTLWAYDERSHSLFVGDAFAFTHHHAAGECALASNELPRMPDIEQIGFLNEAALYWTRFVDLERYFDRFDEAVSGLAIDQIAPAHGALIADPGTMVPVIKDGMRAAQERSRAQMQRA